MEYLDNLLKNVNSNVEQIINSLSAAVNKNPDLEHNYGQLLRMIGGLKAEYGNYDKKLNDDLNVIKLKLLDAHKVYASKTKSIE